MRSGSRFAVIVIAVLALLVPILSASAESITHSNEFFERTWERTDRPVERGQVNRTWMWGPGPVTGPTWEQYVESPNGQREVQYYDKSRMERNLTGESEDSIWYVTNGLLVVEMVTGRGQVGDNTFIPHEAETSNVAGDRHGTTGPTYAALDRLRPAVGDRGQELIVQIVDHRGNVTEDSGLSDKGIRNRHFDEVTGHNVAAPFWEFMTSSGLIYEDGNYVHGPMFVNPYYATGRPITEPYWAHIPVAGNEQWVLLQAFERRVLTYTPGNPAGWKVEAGNTGRHYFEWKYGYPPNGPGTSLTLIADPERPTIYHFGPMTTTLTSTVEGSGWAGGDDVVICIVEGPFSAGFFDRGGPGNDKVECVTRKLDAQGEIVVDYTTYPTHATQSGSNTFEFTATHSNSDATDSQRVSFLWYYH